MKFVFIVSELALALMGLQRGLANRTKIAALRHVQFVGGKDHLATASITDLQTTVTYRFPDNSGSGEPSALILPHKELLRLVKGLRGDKCYL